MGRTAVACDPCRERKRKCDGQRPTCEPCQAWGSPCRYGRISHPKRKKYWDQNYVQSLENQVRTLSASAAIQRDKGGKKNDEAGNTAEPKGTEINDPSCHRSPKAVSDFTSLFWPTTPGSSDEPLFAGPGYFNIPYGKPLPAFDVSDMPPHSGAEMTILQISRNLELKEHLKQVFLDVINPHYNFVDESWLQFANLFPENDPALQFLYSTVFGLAAHCSPRTTHGEAECFIEYAESHVLTCCRKHPCVSVLRGLLIISCYKHAIVECSQGWMYHYMALGMSSTLQVGQAHRLLGKGSNPLETVSQDASVRTFWSLLFADGFSTPALGASRMLWDLSEVPSYLSTLPPGSTNTAAVAFEYHCKLVRIQQDHLDPIYTPKFQTFSWTEKEDLFLKAYNALNLFRQTINSCLLLTRTSRPNRAQLVLWVSYYAACISLHRRYLDPAGLHSTARSQSSLREITAAADDTTRLLQKLDALEELAKAPSFLAYHVFRAALVHAINMTSEEEKLKKRATHGLRACFSALITLRDNSWPIHSRHILSYLQLILVSWGFEVGLITAAPRRA